MCVICGCSTGAPASTLSSSSPSSTLHYGLGPTQASVPGLSETRAVQIEADVLGANNRHAKHNRQHFAMHGVAAYNLVSSPGSGKTTLLCATIEALKTRAPALPLAVIEGDQQTNLDADRIRATGAQAVQVNTGRGCHLDARMVADAFEQLALHAQAHQNRYSSLSLWERAGVRACDITPNNNGSSRHSESPHLQCASGLASPDRCAGSPHAARKPRFAPNPLPEGEGAIPLVRNESSVDVQKAHQNAPLARGPQSLLLIENVGNLVCPALWDLGERAKVVVLSVTEGDDKPLKYPDMFAASHLMLINKVDLLPHVQFSVARCIEYARRVNPAIEVIEVSATRGDGMAAWLDWLLAA